MSEPRKTAPSPDTRLRQHPERSSPEEATDILAAGHVAHLGFAVEGQPYVIPFAYHFDPATPDLLTMHGSLSSRALEVLASGAPVCATITIVDGLIASKTALYHSMNYRSAICFGRGRAVTDRNEKHRLFTAMIGRYFRGRSAGTDYEAPLPEHLEATAVIELRIESITAKTKRGGPRGPNDEDPSKPGTPGVVPL